MGKRGVWVLLAAVAAVVVATTGTSATATPPTPSAVAKQFRKSTGRALVVDKLRSRPGRYTAFGVVDSVSNNARFGQFTLYVVTSGVEDDVTTLMVNSRTGELGTPGNSKIYWEAGRYLSGQQYMLGKKRYGSSVVLWWYGDEAKIDSRFKRLHRALLPFMSR